MSNNLYWVFTKYGKDRLINFKDDDHLYLQTMGIGSYDWYSDTNKILGDGGYSEQAFREYFESTDDTSLCQPIENGVFPITYKDSVDDGQGRKRVIFSITIPEDFPECTVRELGLYENNKLFAICTMQEYHRASMESNHYISSKFNAILTSTALASVYDKIVINPDNDFATADDLIQIEENLLFIETNLAEQISENANLIGLNRCQQLHEKIEDDKRKYSSFAATTAYSNFLNITSLDKIPAFWVFRPNNIAARSVAISDLSNFGINLQADMVSKKYDSGYEGLCSWLDFSKGHEYSLGSDVVFSLISDEAIATKDITPEDDGKVTRYKIQPFTFFWVGAQNKGDETHTILAKDNKDTVENNPPEFLFQVQKNRSIKVRLYTNRNNYLEATTPENSVPQAGEFYVLSIQYSGRKDDANPITIQVNGNKLTTNVSYSLGIANFKGMPVKEYKKYQIPLVSYIPTPTGNIEHVNSKVSMMTLIKDDLSDSYTRAVTFNFMALIGRNPCLI